MDPQTAKEVMEYLRKNPEAAKAALEQAQRIQQQQPGMAQQVCTLQSANIQLCTAPTKVHNAVIR